MAFCSSLKCVTEVKQNSSFLVRDSWCAGWSCEDNGSRAGKTLAVSTDCRAMGAGSRLFPPPNRSVAVSWGRTLGWHCFFWVPPVSKCLSKCMCLRKWEQSFVHSFKFVDIDVSGKTLSVRMGTASTTKFWEVGRRRFRTQHDSGSMRRHSCLLSVKPMLHKGREKKLQKSCLLVCLPHSWRGDLGMPKMQFLLHLLLFPNNVSCSSVPRFTVVFGVYSSQGISCTDKKLCVLKEQVILEEINLLFLEFVFFQKLLWAAKHLFWQGADASPLIFCAFLYWERKDYCLYLTWCWDWGL